jgi:Protein of unknown function (DUF3604)
MNGVALSVMNTRSIASHAERNQWPPIPEVARVRNAGSSHVFAGHRPLLLLAAPRSSHGFFPCSRSFGVKLAPEVPTSIQERAYTSPIWYNPEG